MAEVLSTCYLNGQFQDIENAKISVLDRGFIFGDAVYEVIPVCDGTAFGLDEHLARLNRSLEAIFMPLPQPPQGWHRVVDELITRNGGGNQSIYLQISRGVAPRDHAISADLEPTTLLFSMATSDLEGTGVSVICADDPRWQRCDIKATSLLANVLLRSQASRAKAYETILFRDGMLTEGAASNVFIVIDGKIMTPKADARILPGVTRQFVIDALRGTAWEVWEQDIDRDMFSKASEMWVTSSTRDLVPVTECDDKPVGSGDIGEVYTAVSGLFKEFKAAFLQKERQKLQSS